MMIKNTLSVVETLWLVRLQFALKTEQKYRGLIYDEINWLNDVTLIKAIPMNYMCKIVSESGIGSLYPSGFIFESSKKEIKLEISYSDSLKLGGNKNKIFCSLVIYQKGNVKSKFLVEESRWEELVTCISEQISMQ